jgi:secreted trypsin-like serine protease
LQVKLFFCLAGILWSGCGAPPSQTRSTCSAFEPQSSLNIEDGSETTSYPSVVLVMSGNLGGSMAKCTGTIVGHNSVLTAAHCITGSADSVYVMQTLSLRSSAEHSQALKTAISPRQVISRGPIEISTTTADIAKLANDLAVLIFADQTFQQKDVIVPSLHQSSRPQQFVKTTMVGFGKSHENDNTDTSIKRIGRGFYLANNPSGKDLIFTFNRELNPQTLSPEGPKIYSQAWQGDSGGPLFYTREAQLELVGVLSAGGHSSDGVTTRSVYVDLFSQRSLDLLNQAIAQGAYFTPPSEASSTNAWASSDSPANACFY